MPDAANPSARHVKAAEGFIELGMFRDANEELEQIDAERRTEKPVMEVRGTILFALQKWEALKILASALMRHSPEVHHWLWLADACQHTDSLEKSHALLLEAAKAYPDCGKVHYALATYECALGNLEAARLRMMEAFKFAPHLREPAMDDPALAAVWAVLDLN